MPNVMWQPSQAQKKQSQMLHFLSTINNAYQLNLSNYDDLYAWSINEKEKFWRSVWQFCAIKASSEPTKILIAGESMRDSQWFQGARLNFTENLLRKKNEDIAIIFNNEKSQRQTYTYKELYSATSKIAHALKQLSINKNDRVAAVLPNMPETIISMLATTSLGAIWSSASPDFGKEGLLDRFNQIQPKILIISDGYYYNGKFFSNEEKINWLRNKIPSIEKIILVNYCNQSINTQTIDFHSLLNEQEQTLHSEQLPFDHPVYIMFSSGTTGIPKCIVHGAGGTLIQHLKELMLHTDVKASDKIFYYTTCGWMMWNWYISSLATGATIIQYDGAPFFPKKTRLIDFIDEEGITIFGTSAKYISAIEKNNLHPAKTHSLQSLHTILSTGSPLVPKNFDFIYQQVKKEVCLSSISGGTDIISCFALGNPLLPVYRGELQCIGLGMKVKIYNDEGKAVINEKGELICSDVFPSMPIYFWNDPHGEKYQQAYFEKFPGVWAHGDFAEITDRNTMIIYGRSDATLNPGGIRIGTAEIYRQVEKIPEVLDSLAVSQEWDDDSRILLFVILKDNMKLNSALETKIKNVIRENCSPRHEPAKIIAVPDIPRTISGKTVELAVREIIHKRPVKNISAIANPESLDFFSKLIF